MKANTRKLIEFEIVFSVLAVFSFGGEKSTNLDSSTTFFLITSYITILIKILKAIHKKLHNITI